MSMKISDLARQMQMKIDGQMKGRAAPGRFGAASAAVPDRKEQRKLDSAAGLVPFACKLPAELNQQLRERAAGHAGGINGLVAELLKRGLSDAG
ncbi:MAG: hypothetical protein ABI574_10560 [Burkholderiales bacterium]